MAAFVTFDEERSIKACLNAFRGGGLWNWLCYRKIKKFRGEHKITVSSRRAMEGRRSRGAGGAGGLRLPLPLLADVWGASIAPNNAQVKRAEPPTNVLYENLKFGSKARFFRKVVVGVIITLLLILTFLAVTEMRYRQERREGQGRAGWKREGQGVQGAARGARWSSGGGPQARPVEHWHDLLAGSRRVEVLRREAIFDTRAVQDALHLQTYGSTSSRTDFNS